MRFSRLLLCLVLLVCILPWGTLANDELVVNKIIAAGRPDNQVMDHLDYLVNRIGPRLTSSDKLTQACEWARDRLASYGLEARIEEWGEFPVGFNRASSPKYGSNWPNRAV